MFAKFRRLAVYALPHWRLLAAILLLTGGSVALGVLQPWPLKVLVDNALGSLPLPPALAALSQVGTGGLILLVAGAYLALFAISSGLDAVLSYAWTRAGQHGLRPRRSSSDDSSECRCCRISSGRSATR
jgi:ABC-type multidrug transport system fused ATPase/permease subunit